MDAPLPRTWRDATDSNAARLDELETWRDDMEFLVASAYKAAGVRMPRARRGLSAVSDERHGA